jgi:hypothetical protein
MKAIAGMIPRPRALTRWRPALKPQRRGGAPRQTYWRGGPQRQWSFSAGGHSANGLAGWLARHLAKRSRVVAGVAAVLVAGGSLMLFAAPASAQDGPPEVGCTTGSSCMIELNYDVTYTGSSGGSNGVVVPPPPCIGVPFGDAHTGSQAIISLLYNNNAPVSQPSSPPPSPSASATPTAGATGSGTGTPTPTAAATTPSAAASTTPPPPSLDAQQQAILTKAQQLVNTNPIAAGEWYQVTGDPYATSSAQQRCNNLPPYIWVPGGSNLLRVDGVNVPPATLAGLAYSQLTTAQLSKVTLNPTGTSDTNLPTFVDADLKPPARGVLSVTAKGDPYVWATATTPDGESATVWAWATGLTISPGTANATTFNQQRCSVAHLSADGHTYVLGSRYPQKAMAQVGVGQQIDCGVTYTAPGTYNLTANVTWNACWAKGMATTDGPPPGCKPVPGAAGLAASTSAPDQVTVREIQSVNNG